MYYIKRSIAFLLSIVMLLSTVFVVAPEEVRAENAIYSLYSPLADAKAIVYKGISDLYIGDFLEIFLIENWGEPNESETSMGTLSQQKGVTYESSKPEVATVSKNGLIKTKNKGTTVITVKYKTWKHKLTLKVVDKKKFEEYCPSTIAADSTPHYYEDISTINKKAKAFLKKTGTNPKIDSSNRYTLLNAYNSYSVYDGYKEIRCVDGKYEGPYVGKYIYSPLAARAGAAWRKIERYCNKYNPFSTSASDCFKIKSISGKGGSKTIKVKLKDEISANQIFGAQVQFNWDSYVKKTSTYTFPIIVRNTSNGYKYYATATAKKGSKEITIKLKNEKLKKGKTYELLAQTSVYPYSIPIGNWLDGSVNKYKFKAK